MRNDHDAPSSPLLSPAQRASEIVFGIIMALSITAAISVGGASRETTRELLVAALACNVAWGMVDAAMYLINTMVERARRRRVAQELLGTNSDEELLAALARSSEFEMAHTINAEGAARLRGWLERHGEALPDGLSTQDFLAALQIWLLVFGATLPLVVPFVFIGDPTSALRVSQAIAVALLFGLGMRLGSWIGARPWRAGASFASVGVVITAACIALGG